MRAQKRGTDELNDNQVNVLWEHYGSGNKCYLENTVSFMLLCVMLLGKSCSAFGLLAICVAIFDLIYWLFATASLCVHSLIKPELNASAFRSVLHSASPYL